MAQEVYIAPPPPRQSRNWSCCLWGCLVAFIFVVLLSIALFLIARSTLTSIRDNYTSTEPQSLPAVEVEPGALDALVTRVDAFADSVETRVPAAPLVLEQDEINALIQHHPDWQDLHDKVYVEIDGDMINGLVNFPLTGIPMMSGRYLHGSVTFDVSLEDGRLQVYVDSATVNGEPLPEEFMTAIRQENLAQEFMRDNPNARDVVDQLESVRVEDGKLIIVPKQIESTDKAPAEQEPAADEAVGAPGVESVEAPAPEGIVEQPEAETTAP